ncbi:MAG TPA: hypothetical protein H9869_03245 [Candidatus Ligilactobacillus excrementipullorum]|nr:hypothetical protein [Candidatus Ligilactobacillus excrementipullorum]
MPQVNKKVMLMYTFLIDLALCLGLSILINFFKHIPNSLMNILVPTVVSFVICFILGFVIPIPKLAAWADGLFNNQSHIPSNVAIALAIGGPTSYLTVSIFAGFKLAVFMGWLKTFPLMFILVYAIVALLSKPLMKLAVKLVGDKTRIKS